ncbi:MAG: TonB family protein [Pyrinomonadaceae bacterium]
MSWIFIALTLGILVISVPVDAQERPSAKQFEKMVRTSKEPLFVDGERVYRASEVKRSPVVIFKPEPMYTEKARKKKAEGMVLMRVVFRASGEVKILNVLKRLPHGLTEQALEAAVRIKFEPAILDSEPVSQTILLEYHFNRS